MGPESWEHVASDEGFAKYIANQVRDEFPDKANIEAMVERAIRSERA
jgi:hypothetical protein